MENNKSTIENVFLISLLLLITSSIVIDLTGIVILTIPYTEIEFHSLVINLFGIQASISTLGIALLALVTESIKDKKYGIRVGHHLMTNHTKYLTHQAIIIIEIIILLLNYISLSFKLLNTSVAFFVASLLLTLFLVKDILKLFTNIEQVHQEIESYIINNLRGLSEKDNDINLDKINDHIVDLAFEHKILEFKDNLQIYYKLYKDNEIDKSIIEKYYVDLYKRVSYFESRDVNEILYKSLLKMYEIANEKEHYVEFINEMQIQIYDVISSLPQKYYYKDHDFPYLSLYIAVSNNDAFSTNGSQTLRFVSGLYSSVFKKIDWEESYSKVRINAFYEILYYDLKDNSSNSIEVINSFTRSLLLNEQSDALSSGFFNNIAFYTSDNEQAKNTHFLTILSYMYYILDEKIANESVVKLQKYVEELLLINKPFVSSYLYELNMKNIDLYKLMQDIKKQINNWEIFPESLTIISTKFMVGGNIVEKFFLSLFVSCIWDIDSLAKYIQESKVSVKNYHREITQQTSRFTESVKLFRDNFMEDEHYGLEGSIEILKNTLNEIIIDNKLSEIQKFNIDEYHRRGKDLTSKVELKVNEHLAELFENNNNTLNQEYEFEFSEIIPLNLFDDNEFIEEYTIKRIQAEIIKNGFHELEEMIKEATVGRKDKNQLKVLFDEIENMGKTFDIMIGIKNHFQFRNDPLLDKYTKLLDEIRIVNINIGGSRNIFINSKDLMIELSQIDVIFKEVSEARMLAMSEKGDEKYIFDDNEAGMKYVFTKEELTTLFDRKYREITWKSKVSYLYNPKTELLSFRVSPNN